jgi:hypothetical protein
MIGSNVIHLNENLINRHIADDLQKNCFISDIQKKYLK